MRSFLRNRRFKNFAFKIDVLCSCLLLNSKSFSLAANSNNTLTPSDDLNAGFETFAPRTISIRRFSNGVPGQPGERGNGVLFTYKDAANYGWSIVVINGNIYTRKIANGNIEDWKSIATK